MRRTAQGQRLRVAFVLRRAWPAAGGIESFGRDLAIGLSKRHDVRMFAQRIDEGTIRPVLDGLRGWRRFEPRTLPESSVRVEQLRISALRRLALISIAPQYAPPFQRRPHGWLQRRAGFVYGRIVAPELAEQAGGSDVIHALGGNEVAIAAVAAARLLGIPSVVTPSAHPGQWDDDAASAEAYRQADAVVANLDADADTYRALGVSAERLHVREHCSRRLCPGQAPSRGRGGPLVLYLGNRRPHKGVDLLLQAADLVHRQRPDVTFAFVGPGPELEAPSGENVLDVGRVDDAEKAGWLDAADLLCLPSAAESFGLVVIEAWSVGTPAVVSDIPALRELVTRGGGGIVVERTAEGFSEAILSLLADSARLRRLGETGRRRWLTHHTPEACARWHEELYSRLRSEVSETKGTSPDSPTA